MSTRMCPYGEEDLLSVALGQPSSDEMQAHVTHCSVCQRLLFQLREESAHRLGIVPQHVKPANILIDEAGQPLECAAIRYPRKGDYTSNLHGLFAWEFHHEILD